MYLESRINSYTRTNAYVDKILISFGIHSKNAFSYSNEALYTYTECPRRNVLDFGMVFLMSKYTYITQNTYVQS
jgi:hypothetical protein